MSKDRLPVLEIVGLVPSPAYPKLWEAHKHETVQLEDYVVTKATEGQQRYQHILVTDALQRIPVQEAQRLLDRIRANLAPGGRLNLIVPAMEWACRQLLMDSPNPAVFTFIWGTHASPQACWHGGWTMRMLRGTLELAGYDVKRAVTNQVLKEFAGYKPFSASYHALEAEPGA